MKHCYYSRQVLRFVEEFVCIGGVVAAVRLKVCSGFVSFIYKRGVNSELITDMTMDQVY